MGPTAGVKSREFVRSTRIAPPVHLTPARPGAVVLPALTSTVVVAGLSGLVEYLLGRPDGGVGPALVASGFSIVVLLHAYCLRVLLRSRIARFRAERLLVLLTALLVVSFEALAPGVSLHTWTLVTIGVASLAAMRLAVLWRHEALKNRPLGVSLLAPSEMAAEEALARIGVLPGIRVQSVVIPGCVVERASRMLDCPVARAVGGVLQLERRVVVACPKPDDRVGSAIAQLVALGHTITSETAIMRRAEGRVDSLRVNALNLLMSVPRSHVANMVRRLVDVVISAFVMIVFSPLFLAAAIAIVIDSGWPIFYRQERVGRRGRLFQVIKFRTMRKDAEKLSGPVFASERDPRITRIGNFMRRYRIDELPQFWNVLRGQMSLVGPRPERPHFFNVLRQDVPLFELRTFVPPGITGWAQIRLPYASDSNEARAKLEYDLYYVTHRSLVFDMAILFETLGVALTGAGSR